MFKTEMESLSDGRAQRFSISRESEVLTYAEVILLWRDDADFRTYFTGLLADCPFAAYRWETPAVTAATLDRNFEFVLLRSDSLARAVNRSAFAAHFSTDHSIATFPNLSGDAVMVVPCPVAEPDIYGHLASFIREAPQSQVHQFWISIAAAMEQRFSERPVWLSTAGMGVSWLHARLDSRPKYYGYRPYREKV